MGDQIVKTFLDQGVLGAIIIALAGVVVYQKRENSSLQKDNNALRDRITSEAKEYALQMIALSKQVTDAIGQLNDLFSKHKRS